MPFERPSNIWKGPRSFLPTIQHPNETSQGSRQETADQNHHSRSGCRRGRGYKIHFIWTRPEGHRSSGRRTLVTLTSFHFVGEWVRRQAAVHVSLDRASSAALLALRKF